MSFPVKPLVGVIGIGTVSTGIYFAIPSKTEKKLSVKERLEKAGYKILSLNKQDNTTHATEGGNVKEAYIKEGEVTLRFSGINKNDENTINGIKDSCSSLLNSESDVVTDLEKARRWCVVPVTVASRMGDTLSLLDTSGSGDSNIWSNKVSEYNNQSSKIPKMPITPSVSGRSVTDSDLKGECGRIKDLYTYSKDFETLVSYAKDGCTKAKGTNG